MKIKAGAAIEAPFGIKMRFLLLCNISLLLSCWILICATHYIDGLIHMCLLTIHLLYKVLNKAQQNYPATKCELLLHSNHLMMEASQQTQQQQVQSTATGNTNQPPLPTSAGGLASLHLLSMNPSFKMSITVSRPNLVRLFELLAIDINPSVTSW
ncbi:hypothetical protein QOT17_004529 [Balamuthia mandrillaris]